MSGALEESTTAAEAAISPLAGKPAPKEMLVDVARLEKRVLRAHARRGRSAISWSASAPADIADRLFTARSPKRTSWRSRRRSANTAERKASTARCTWARIRMRFPRRRSAPRSKCWRRTAWRPSSSENDGVTPTPVISRAILVYNRGRKEHFADGIVITPSHNPPEDGGFKYNPPNGGPADTDVTGWVQDRANELACARTMPA